MISPLWLWPIWLVSILLLCLFGGSTALRALLVLLPLLLAASAAVSCLGLPADQPSSFLPGAWRPSAAAFRRSFLSKTTAPSR